MTIACTYPYRIVRRVKENKVTMYSINHVLYNDTNEVEVAMRLGNISVDSVAELMDEYKRIVHAFQLPTIKVEVDSDIDFEDDIDLSVDELVVDTIEFDKYIKTYLTSEKSPVKILAAVQEMTYAILDVLSEEVGVEIEDLNKDHERYESINALTANLLNHLGMALIEQQKRINH